jgi:hypothetical protein
MEICFVTDALKWNNLVEMHNGAYNCYYEWLSFDAEFNMLDFKPLGLYEHNTLIDIFPLLINRKSQSAHTCGCFNQKNSEVLIAHSESTYSLSQIAIVCRQSNAYQKKTVCTPSFELVSNVSGINSVDVYLESLNTVRKNYKKAIEHNIVVKQEFDCGNFYKFYREMVHRNNVNNSFPLTWFEGLLRRCNGRVEILSAFQQDEAVGSVLYIITKGEIFNYFTVIDYNKKHLQVGTLLFISIYQKAIEKRIPCVNLGPDTYASPTYEFKIKFGARPQPVYTFQYTGNVLLLIQFQLISVCRQFVYKRPKLFKLLRKLLKK